MRHGLASYFKKYAYKNTELEDFLQELELAAEELKFEQNLVEWAHTWLMSSGVNIIKHTCEEDAEKITSFKIHQSCHKYGENRLRKQRF